MITAEMRAEIRRLVLREGWKIETVARRFAIHHSVVRRAIADAPEGATAPPVASALEPFKPYLVERLTLHPELSATRLLLEIRDRGYARSVAILRRYVAKVRAPRAKKAYLRVETEPGEVAQVDWGSFGHMRIGQTHRPLPLLRSCSSGRALCTSTSRSTSAWTHFCGCTRGLSPSSAASPAR